MKLIILIVSLLFLTPYLSYAGRVPGVLYIPCPACAGTGCFKYNGSGTHRYCALRCNLCKGSGRVREDTANWWNSTRPAKLKDKIPKGKIIEKVENAAKNNYGKVARNAGEIATTQGGKLLARKGAEEAAKFAAKRAFLYAGSATPIPLVQEIFWVVTAVDLVYTAYSINEDLTAEE